MARRRQSEPLHKNRLDTDARNSGKPDTFQGESPLPRRSPAKEANSREKILFASDELSIEADLFFRRMLFGGVIGAASGTLAWLLWFFKHVVDREPAALLAPIVGAGVALIFHSLGHYINCSLAEHNGQVTHEPAVVSKRKVLIAAVLGALAFMGVVGEHVLASLVEKFLIEFLASVVTLFPAGAIIIGLLEECKEKELSLGFRFNAAILATLLVAIAVIGVHVVLEFGKPGHTPFLDLIKPVWAWWFLFNFCTWLVAVRRIALTDAAPILGVLLSALLICLVALPIGHSLLSMPWLPDALKHSPIAAVGHYGEEVIDFSLVYPGTPQQFWAAAELESHEVLYSRPLGWGPWLASLVENPRSSSNDKTVADRRHLLATQLRLEFGSGLVRSWLVMFFFACGISLAPAAERRLRPLCYGASVTRRKDVLAWLIALVFLALAVVVVHVR